jgi:hypothetical protein
MLTLERENSRSRDLVGVQRALRDEQQCVDLAHGAVDAPPAPHLAEVRDELAAEGRQMILQGHGRDFVRLFLKFQKVLKFQICEQGLSPAPVCAILYE